ncbi:hypothetical protein TNCV_219871 [Trichonephila clavipes]|nr:hypothetical protein TNCV_219871 [Trichonephila clavipes]
MQYHGVGRHHDQWHAPTCGCEWDYDGPNTLMTSVVRLFRGAVGDKFVFIRQRNMSSNTRCNCDHKNSMPTFCLTILQI